ncbi:MAG: hypothetical protein PHE79_05165 [Eubacteriales bacterium]|nr:hypothetical protein [Eubacteriales bacterium]
MSIDWDKLNARVRAERKRINEEQAARTPTIKQTVQKKMAPAQKPVITAGNVSYVPVKAKKAPAVDTSAIMDKYKNIEVKKVDLPMMGAGATIPSRLRTAEQKQADDLRQAKAMSNSAAARLMYGAGEGLHFLGHEKKTPVQKDIKTMLDETASGKAGKIAGQVAQFGVGYGAASAPITGALKGIQAFSKLGKVGQGVARSAVLDTAVGLPLNANIALNKEGLRGEDALRNIALNTAIDLVAGGALEVIGGVLLKSGKKVATKGDFDALPASEKGEVLTEIERLAYESNVRKGKITPQGDTLYGNAPRPIAGELPAPDKINPSFNPTRKGLADPYADFNKEYEAQVERLAGYIRGYKGKGVEVWVIPKGGDELMRDGGIRVAQSNNDLWYQDFYKSHGRAPRKSEAEDIARELIDEGLLYRNSEFADEDLALLLQDARYRDKTLPRIDEEVPKVVRGPEIPKSNKEVPRTVTPGEMSSPVDNFKARLRGSAQGSDTPVQARTAEVEGIAPLAAKQAQTGEKNAVDTNKTIKALEEEIEKQKLYNTQLYESMPSPSRADPSNKRAEPILAKWRESSEKLKKMTGELNELKDKAALSKRGETNIPNKTFVNSYGEATTREITNAGYERAQSKLSKEMMSFVGGKPAQKGGRNAVGAAAAKPEKTLDELVKEHGAIPKGEQLRAREVDIPKKTNHGDVQQHARTLQESAIVDDTLYKEINEAIKDGFFSKPTKGNKVAVDNANNIIEEKGLDSAVERFRSVLKADKKVTSEDIALGNRILQDLQKAGRYDEALEVATDLSQMLSETGRTLQAAKIAKRLSPEGRLLSITKTADKLSKKHGKKIKVSDETVEAITKAKTEKEIVEANHKAAVEIWDQTPPNWMDKINSWRYIAMLFNPKTHMRNIVGNALFVPAREVKNLIGAGLEKGLIKNGERTKAILHPTKDADLIKFANDDFANVKPILKNEGKVDDNVRKIEAKVFDTKALESIRKMNLGALDAEDTWFMQFAYDSSLAQYMKANKLKPADMVGETLEKGRKYAMNEALKAAYRDFNSLGRLISRGKGVGASGKYGVMGKVGSLALEGAIPFAKTPLNLIKRGVGYSPANIVRGIVNLKRVKTGKVTATEAIDQLASGLSGTALVGLGMTLGHYGIVSGGEDDFRDKTYNYNRMLGSQSYSLQVDGTSYTLDWAAPLSMPFFVGVELSKAFENTGGSLFTVLDSMANISDPMINMSMLQGVNNIFHTVASDGPTALGQVGSNLAMGYLGQFNPTLGGQIARTIDSARRSTISTAESQTGRTLEKYGRKQLGKLPGASQSLEPYIDLWGREEKSAGGLENFLSPGYFKKENITEVDKELKSLLEGLDEETAKKIIPASSAYQYSITSNKKQYRMTEKESTAYQKTRGQESFNGLEKLFDSAEYRRMTSDEKAKAIEDVYSDAKEKAEYEYFKNKGLSVTLAMSSDDQAKYARISTKITGERFYSAAADMRTESTDIAKVYAIESKGKVPDSFYSEFNISERSVALARTLKNAGLTAEQYTTAREKADTNQSSNISKAEAVAYLNKQRLSRRQKFIMLKTLVPTLKDQNNPYR